MSRRLVNGIGAAFVCAFLLSGCAAANPSGGADAGEAAASAPPAQSAEPAEPAEAAAPRVQAESCDWDSERLASGDANAAAGASEVDLAVALIGSWQHTHIDEGAGFEALAPTTDIRYVFPSADRILYCQDVEGATSQAENAADITLDGLNIVLPSPATGYTVSAWDDETMVWINNRDGSLYLLKRR